MLYSCRTFSRYQRSLKLSIAAIFGLPMLQLISLKLVLAIYQKPSRGYLSAFCMFRIAQFLLCKSTICLLFVPQITWLL